VRKPPLPNPSFPYEYTHYQFSIKTLSSDCTLRERIPVRERQLAREIERKITSDLAREASEKD